MNRKSINIEWSFIDEETALEFLRMLAWMETCGNIGHSTSFKVLYDGDGSARFRFKFDEEISKVFAELKTKIKEDNYSDIEGIYIEKY